MDAGGVYHLLAQARHLEEIQPVREDPKSVELRRLGRLGDPNTEDGILELSPIRHLCWLWHHEVGTIVGRSPPCCGWIAMKIGRTWIARIVINETKQPSDCRGWIRLSKSA